MDDRRDLMFDDRPHIAAGENTLQQQDRLTDARLAQGNGVFTFEQRKAIGHLAQGVDGTPLAVVVMAAAPLFNVAVPNARPPYLKVTSPVGVPCAAVTVAVKTAGWPTIDGFGWDCTVVVVASRPAIVVDTLAVIGGNPITLSW